MFVHVLIINQTLCEMEFRGDNKGFGICLTVTLLNISPIMYFLLKKN